MKATYSIILITIFLLHIGNKEVKGQPSLVPARESSEVKTGIHIGERAPDIVLESPTGEKISLSSLRGKVVLIDFWAAWCPPCRRDNPNLVKLYHHYKDKEFENGSGFAIYSVSLDTKKEDWIAAIEQDSLDWDTHVSDLKGRQSAPVGVYEVRSIPFNTIIDGDGIILAVGLRGSHLEAKLEELVK